MATINNETLAKEFFSKSVLSEIQDKGLANTIRQIMFADNTKIDWQQALQIASKNMPELSQEIKESCECDEEDGDILTEDDLIDVSDESSDNNEDDDSLDVEIPDVNDIGSTTRFDREKDLNDENDEEIINEDNYDQLYIDNGSGFTSNIGDKVRYSDFKKYWDNNHDSDPSLSNYKSFNAWFSDTEDNYLEPVYDEDELTEELEVEDTETSDVTFDDLKDQEENQTRFSNVDFDEGEKLDLLIGSEDDNDFYEGNDNDFIDTVNSNEEDILDGDE